MSLRGRAQVELEDDDENGHQADRHVDVEHPPPGNRLDEESSQQRSGDRGDRKHRAEQAQVATALAGRDDVGDDRLCPDHQPTGADSLHCAERDQLDHRLAEPGQQRPGQEDQDRGEEHGLAPVHVAELAVERRRRSRSQQIGRDDPGQMLEPAEVSDDGRQRGRDDRLVERRQEHPEHQRAEHGRQRAARGRFRARSGAILRGRAHALLLPVSCVLSRRAKTVARMRASSLSSGSRNLRRTAAGGGRLRLAHEHERPCASGGRWSREHRSSSPGARRARRPSRMSTMRETRLRLRPIASARSLSRTVRRSAAASRPRTPTMLMLSACFVSS